MASETGSCRRAKRKLRRNDVWRARRSSHRSPVPRDQRISEKNEHLFSTLPTLSFFSPTSKVVIAETTLSIVPAHQNTLLAMASQAVSVVCVGMAGKAMNLARDRHSNVRTLLTNFCYRLWKDDIHATNQLSSTLQENRPLCHEP